MGAPFRSVCVERGLMCGGRIFRGRVPSVNCRAVLIGDGRQAKYIVCMIASGCKGKKTG